jgi:peptidoglycan hydrolase CwlO-like protein
MFAVSCLTLYSLFLIPIYAQDCSNETECKKLIEEYESKLTGIRAQKNTLSSQIQYFDTQIYIATTRIRETELKVKQTEEEIVSLGEKIDGLNTSLDYLGKVLIRKIAEGYKRKQTTIIDLVVDSNNAMSLSNQLKYIQISQDNDRRIAFQVQQAKTNFEEQKTLREKKKIELADLQVTLNLQRASLDTQKTSKEKLLVDTNNDENTYQNLLSQARSQLSAFSTYVQSSGADSTVGPDGLGK